MKRVYFTVVLLFVLSYSYTLPAYAQSWLWGRAVTGGFSDGGPIAVDPSGNIFVASVTTGNSGFGSYTLAYNVPKTGDGQTFIAKYDVKGNLLWANGTQNGNTAPIDIATDQKGNAFLFGILLDASMQVGPVTLTNTIFPDGQYFLVKFDPLGNVIWAKNEGNTQSMGSIYSFFANLQESGGVTTDAAGNVFITTNFYLPKITIGSYTLENADKSGNTSDILLAKYDPDGNVIWAKSSGGTGNDYPYDITITPAKDIYIAGVFNSPTMPFGKSTITYTGNTTGPSGYENAFIARYDSSGTSVWADGSGGAGNEYASGLACDTANNVYLTGGVLDSVISFSSTNIVNPYFRSTNPGSAAAYLIKFDPTNNVSWYKTIEGSTNYGALGYSTATSPCGNVWICGSFKNDNIDIDGHTLKVSDSSCGDPVFIAGFNSSGTYITGTTLPSGGDDEMNIACDASGNVCVCGDYRCTGFFTIGGDTLASAPSYDPPEWLYVGSYSFDTLYQHENINICEIPGLLLSAPPGYLSYMWDDGSTDAAINITAIGNYRVLGLGKGVASDSSIATTDANVCRGGFVVDSITVTTNPDVCSCNVFLPSAFTPNGDGRNDTYYPVFLGVGCYITNYSFAIYNRWGQQVFYSNNQDAKWDGSFLNVKAELGVYMYYLKYNYGANRPAHILKGDVTLIR